MQLAGTIALAAIPTLILPVGLFVTGYGLRQLRIALALRGTDGTIADLGGGYEYARGTARPDGATVEAPFTGTECVVSEAAIEDWVSDTDGTGGHWQSKETVQESCEFLIEDDTGRARVLPAEADWQMAIDHEHHVDQGEAPTGPYADFVESRDVFIFDDEAVAETHDFRFVERRIDVDGPAAVLGPSTSKHVGRARVGFGPSGIPGAWLLKPFVLSNEAIDGDENLLSGAFLTVFGLIFSGAALAFLRAIVLS